jgi:hypothetical protein
MLRTTAKCTHTPEATTWCEGALLSATTCRCLPEGCMLWPYGNRCAPAALSLRKNARWRGISTNLAVNFDVMRKQNLASDRNRILVLQITPLLLTELPQLTTCKHQPAEWLLTYWLSYRSWQYVGTYLSNDCWHTDWAIAADNTNEPTCLMTADILTELSQLTIRKNLPVEWLLT